MWPRRRQPSPVGLVFPLIRSSTDSPANGGEKLDRTPIFEAGSFQIKMTSRLYLCTLTDSTQKNPYLMETSVSTSEDLRSWMVRSKPRHKIAVTWKPKSEGKESSEWMTPRGLSCIRSLWPWARKIALILWSANTWIEQHFTRASNGVVRSIDLNSANLPRRSSLDQLKGNNNQVKVW